MSIQSGRRILSRFPAAQETLPRDGHHLLELLVETCASLQTALDEDARRPLAVAEGSSKTARLSRTLCAMAPAAESPPLRAAATEALAARLDRIERSGLGA